MILLGLHLIPQVLIISYSALLLARFHLNFTLPVLLVQLLKYLKLLSILGLFNLSLIHPLLHLLLQLRFEHFCRLRLVHLLLYRVLKMLLIFFQLCFRDTHMSQVVFLDFSEACDTSSCSCNFLLVFSIIKLSLKVFLGSLLNLSVIDFYSGFNIFVIDILLNFALRFAPLLL